MSIEAASSSTMAMSGAGQVSSSSSVSKSNSSSDASFKDEMSKVDAGEGKKEVSEKKSDTSKKDVKSEKKETSKKVEEKSTNNAKETVNSQEKLNAEIAFNNALNFNNVNMMLANDIQQMVENTAKVDNIKTLAWGMFDDSGSKSSLKMNETDAQFFIDLANTDNVNIQGVTAQAQAMVDNGVSAAQVKQNFQVSQALLNALSESRENNQPVRIDFDNNMSVILRVGRDGAISAQFIPGDKAVEQYLKQNIESLKNSFAEQELPYSDLSYSHSSKEQNKRRQEEKRQGES